MSEKETLQAQLDACRAAQVPLRTQLNALAAEEREIGAALAPLLCGIPVGSVFEITRQHHQGRWRVTGHRLEYKSSIEVIATKLKQDGTESKITDVRFWDWQRLAIIERPTPEEHNHAE